VPFARILVVSAVLAAVFSWYGLAEGSTVVALAGAAVALFLLAAYPLAAGPQRARTLRWPLVLGLLVFAVATATGQVWRFLAVRATPDTLSDLSMRPDLAHERSVSVWALVGCLCVTVTTMRLLGRRGAAAVVAGVTVAALVLLAGGALAVRSVGTTPGAWVQAVPAFTAAVVLLTAAIVDARRTGNAMVWVGLVLLALPALVGAAEAASLADWASFVDELSDGNTAAPLLRSGSSNTSLLSQVLIGAARLAGAGMVAVGAVRQIDALPGPPSTGRSAVWPQPHYCSSRLPVCGSRSSRSRTRPPDRYRRHRGSAVTSSAHDCPLPSKAAKVGVLTCGSQSGSDRWRSNLVRLTLRIRWI
jgi:hypothetical protein